MSVISRVARMFSAQGNDSPPQGWFLWATIIGWGIELFYGLSSQPTIWDGIRVFCLLWFASGAAFFVGTIGGFLFGLPKTKTGTQNNPTPAEVGRYSGNTNLEEVSDWLTKILVGLGLAEFDKVIVLISSIGDKVGMSIDTNGGGKVMAVGSMLIGFVCGFLYYYIWARLIIHKSFERLYPPSKENH